MENKKNPHGGSMEPPAGFMLIDKPSGWTSFDIVAKLRSLTGVKKIGHAGTLDPFATGLLLVAIGRKATRQIALFMKEDKEYITTLHLGAVSSTHDTEGKIEKQVLNKNFNLDTESINNVLKKFTGKQEQIPPMHSAKKIAGQRLYKLARQGKTVKREASEIEIYNIELQKFNWPLLAIKVKCSSGTYIRRLAFDIGQALGCGAYLKELRRTRIGRFSVDKAQKITKIDIDNWTKIIFE